MVTRDGLDRLWSTLRIAGWGAVALILAAPAVAMALNAPGVDWTASDFVLAGGLLIGGAGVMELVAWRVKNPIMRIGFALFLIAVIGLLWVEGAVGIFP